MTRTGTTRMACSRVSRRWARPSARAVATKAAKPHDQEAEGRSELSFREAPEAEGRARREGQEARSEGLARRRQGRAEGGDAHGPRRLRSARPVRAAGASA